MSSFIKSVPLVQWDPALPPGPLNMDRILFLDFDGVLHPEPCMSDLEFCFSANFSEVIMEMDPKGELPIVISSTWRFDQTLDQLRQHLNIQLHRQVVGVTPDIPSPPPIGWDIDQGANYDGKRQREIELWMRTHAPTAQWLALDDQERWFEPGCPNLFLVPDVYDEQGGGISSYQAELLRERLQVFLEVAKPAHTPRV